MQTEYEAKVNSLVVGNLSKETFSIGISAVVEIPMP